MTSNGANREETYQGPDPKWWHWQRWWTGGYPVSQPREIPTERKPDEVIRYDERQRFEHELIDRKINWMLVSQGLLFAAYGVAVNVVTDGDRSAAMRGLGRHLLTVIAGVGIALALLALFGVRVHQISKFHAWQHEEPRGETTWGVVTANTMSGVIFDALHPVVFIVAWTVILILGLRSLP